MVLLSTSQFSEIESVLILVAHKSGKFYACNKKRGEEKGEDGGAEIRRGDKWDFCVRAT